MAGRRTYLIVWPASSFVLDPRVEAIGQPVVVLEPEVAVLEP